MKKNKMMILVCCIVSCLQTAAQAPAAAPAYQPKVSIELYQAIVSADSVFFDAYDHCKLDIINAMISEDLEFYHDTGGLSTSKKETIAALKKNICGKVTRELLPGSIEVYEIANFGAVEMGYHGFHNSEENETGPTHFAKFVHIWKKENNQWKLSRIISLH